jgi:Transcriptional regulator containing an amidase domain and an AraC-type DNA-binding HTH domain
MKEFWIDANCKMNNRITYHYTPSIVAKTAFFYLQSLGHFMSDEEYYTKREGYRSYLLIYTISGKGYAKYRGKFYELDKGKVLFMDCYDYQEYYTDKKDLWQIKWVHFNGSTSSEYYNLIYNKFGPVIDMHDNTRILELLDDIAMLIENGDFQQEVRISKLIVDMLSELLLSETVKDDETDYKMLSGNIRASIEYVEKNYECNISIKDMASSACCSVYHFSRVFKRVTGYSPYEYLTKFRINKAKTLLKSSDLPVEEISGRVGFISNSNFIRTFKTLEDMTPLKYRKYWLG